MGKKIYVSDRWLINNFMYLENYQFQDYFKKDIFENEYYAWTDESPTINSRWNLIGEHFDSIDSNFIADVNVVNTINELLNSEHEKYIRMIKRQSKNY